MLFQFVDRIYRPNRLDLDRVTGFWVIGIGISAIWEAMCIFLSFSVFLKELDKINRRADPIMCRNGLKSQFI